MQARLTLGRKQLPAQEEGYHQSQWCCIHPKDQTFVEFLATWAHHPHQSYHHVQPIRRFRHVQPQSQDTITAKLRTSFHNTYHNHHTLMKPPLGDEHPEDVIQEGTTEKNWTHLIMARRKTKQIPQQLPTKPLAKVNSKQKVRKIESYLITLRLGTLTIWMTVTISVIPW